MKKKAGEQPSWDDLTREAFKVREMSCAPEELRRVKASHIQDEEQSVKWNREWVEKNNARYLEEVKRLHAEKKRCMGPVGSESCGENTNGSRGQIVFEASGGNPRMCVQDNEGQEFSRHMGMREATD